MFSFAGEGRVRPNGFVLPQSSNLRLLAPVAFIGVFVAIDAAAFALSVNLVDRGLHAVLRDVGTMQSAITGIAMMAVFAAVMLHLASKGRYGDRIPFWSELRIILSASWLAACGLAAFALALGVLPDSAAGIGALLIFPFIAAAANRSVKRLLARSSIWAMTVLMIGEGPELVAVQAAMLAAPWLGYRVVRRVDPATLMAQPPGFRLRPLMEQSGARRAIIALASSHPLHRHIVSSASSERVDFAMTQDISCDADASVDAASFLRHDAALTLVRDQRSSFVARVVKLAFDVTVATLMLVASSPLFLVIGLANIGSGGPVFFAHRRVGLGGRSFACLKFRTMRVDGDQVLELALRQDPALAAEWAATRKLRHDPRVTPIGRILRKTSLDELPQLLNVIRLDMSLVGPRPIVEGETSYYGDDIVHYYAARPGLTGLWQVSGRSNTSYARRVRLDVWYVNNRTIWNDVAVLLKTVPAVLVREGAR